MSYVPHAEFHLYQGEDWEMFMMFPDDDAPTEAELLTYDAVMEIRKNNVSRELYVRVTMDDGISVVEGAEHSTLKIEVPKTETRLIPPGTHLTDFFLIPPVAATFPVFTGTIVVKQRVTLEEITP